MPAQELRALLQEFMQAIQLVMESGEVLSDEFQGQIAQTLSLLMERLEEAEGAQPPAQAVQKPSVPAGRQSSNVKGMDYDPKTGNMLVQFLGKHPNQNGPVYQYPNTPPVIAELLQSGAVPARTDGQNKWGKWWKGKVPSAGASVFTLLKDRGAPYQRLS